MTSTVAPTLEHSLGELSLYDRLQHLPTAPDAAQWDALLTQAGRCCDEAFFGTASPERKAQAEEDLHRTLYQIYAWRIAAPWQSGGRDVDDYRYDQLRQRIELAWATSEEARFAGLFGALPDAQGFAQWAEAKCREHRSNVTHPLFTFLRDGASRAQLAEFILQETPFDIHFGDILAKMLPGVYGRFKAELTSNFWDEVGCGDATQMHRQLRLDMTRALGVPDDIYFDAPRFCVEELRLANMYFHAVFNRALLPQAIGMLLATELMVPGRLDYQIVGWRRTGWPDADMSYLLIHTVVDVEHANGWMNEVVTPLLEQCPELVAPMALGMMRRLEYAAAVCDRMMKLLPRVGVADA